jgi:hypothetical protein
MTRLVLTIPIFVGLLACSKPEASTPAKPQPFPGSPSPLAPPQDIATLRVEGWKLLIAVTKPARSGLPLWRTWRQSPEVLSGKPNEILYLEPPKEFEGLADKGSGPYRIYESTFYNPVAARHIQMILQKETTRALLGQSRSEVTEFPPDAIIAKAFWRKAPAAGKSSIGIWDWASPSLGDDDAREENWPQQCISLQKEPGCLTIADNFHMIQVTKNNLASFKCPVGCDLGEVNGIAPGDALFLVGLHVASKALPDWFWATFWWKGVLRQDGGSWTCDNAQRPPEVANSKLWSNYSMDVIASFTVPKPVVAAADTHCGVPPHYARDTQFLAAFNPFVEARLSWGRTSSCIDCHSRATTKNGIPFNYVPKPDRTDRYTGLKDLQGDIRSDYLWTLAHALEPTPLPGP